VTYVAALLIIVAAAGFEGLCAGRDPMGQLKALNQPRWSPPTWVWVLIGIAWYGICLTGLVRLLPFWPEHKVPIILLVAMLLANGAANIPLFRLRRLDLALAFFLPYWVLLAAFMWTVCPLDRLTVALFAIYAAYQVYAALWGYQLLRMNRALAPAPGTDSGAG
jgi:tryptophan-rich sensory protein